MPSGSREIPAASLGRLTIYLRALNGLGPDAASRVSSEELATAAGENPAMLRKDLSYLGSYGTRGVGYDVGQLTKRISDALGLNHDLRVVIVGAGNLGRALAGYSGFVSRGFEMVALFDVDPLVIDREVGWLRVSPVDQLEQVLESKRANMAILSVPPSAAQELCDRLVAAGITSILNFSPTILQVPQQVQVRKVDLATELQILAYHAQRVRDPEVSSESRTPRTG
nr:redox-sensing transcriptional repressor Rex [Arthrobacter roseus]